MYLANFLNAHKLLLGACDAPKPASAPPPVVPSYVETPLCQCVCGGNLTKQSDVAALCVDLIGVHDVTHGIWQCNNFACRVRHAQNFYVLDGGRGMLGHYKIVGMNMVRS